MQTKPILVLEDEFLIAMDVEDILMGAGFTNIHQFSRCDEANSWLDANTLALAILDVRLGDDDCMPTALILHRRHVPFVIYSASVLHDGLHDVLKQAHWLQKPAAAEDLVALVSKELDVARE